MTVKSLFHIRFMTIANLQKIQSHRNVAENWVKAIK